MADKRRLRALITRPQEDAVEVAIALVRRRITPVLAPMMSVVFGSAEVGVDLDQAQAILFTSRNGVRAFSRVSDRRDVKVFAVGDSTTALAYNEGFLSVESAGGDSADLAKLLIEELSPSGGFLFHVTGVSTAGEIRETLTIAGFNVIQSSLYEAVSVSEFSQKTINFIKDGDGDYVLFFSPRTARIFLAHIRTNELEDSCKNLIAISLSQAVADELSIITWRAIAVATMPNTQSVLKAIDEIKEHSDNNDEKPQTIISPKAPDTRGLDRSIEITQDQENNRDHKDDEEQKLIRTNSDFSSFQTPVIDSEKLAVGDQSNRSEIEMRETSDNGTPDRPAKKWSYVTVAAWAGISTLLILIIAYYTLPSWRGFLPHQIKDRLAGINQPSSNQLKIIENIEDLQRRVEAFKQSVGDITLRLSKLESRISENRNLGARVTKNEQVLGQIKNRATLKTPPSPADSTIYLKLDERVKKLEHVVQTTVRERGQGVENATRIGNANLNKMATLEQTIAGLDVRLTELGKRFSDGGRLPDQTPNSNLIVLVIGQLREALRMEQPFAKEIASLKSLAKGNPSILKAVAPIEKLGDRGIQTKADLLGRLPALIKGLFNKAQFSNEKGWVGTAVSQLKQVVTIRRVDGKGTGLEAAVARAELLAAKQDLGGVVAQLTTLHGISSPNVDAWIAAARERLTAETAIIQLNQVAIATLSPSR
ncbi:MAG: uroporphyrinogen-III synthase [Pseudomonadota bacterium]|nr:uroporphyrinogen-III synthase [Pseudomonadota bacterium]